MYPVLSLVIEWAIKTTYIKVYYHVINSIRCFLELQGLNGYLLIRTALIRKKGELLSATGDQDLKTSDRSRGEMDLHVFLGLVPPAELNMDRLPGFKNVTARVKIDADADAKALKELHEHVVRTSPVGVTLSRPVAIKTELEVLQARSAA